MMIQSQTTSQAEPRSTAANAAQTLFRFVSLRNPKLTETKHRNVGFIFRPEGARGQFDESVEANPGQPGMRVLQESAARFAVHGFESEKQIEEGPYGQLLIIGRKIAKKEALDENDLEYVKRYYSELVSGHNELKSDAIGMLENLWNNLIYQVVTQKDFYVKEAIIHVLKALHLGFVQITEHDEDFMKANGEDFMGKAMEARVVLPESLFTGNNSPAGNSVAARNIASQPAVIPAAAQQRLKLNAATDLQVTKALYRKGMLEKLDAELKKMQKTYHKSANKAYQVAYKDYQEKYREQLDAYNRRLAEINSLIDEKTPEEEKQRLYESLRELEVPSFEFSYKSEINLPDLQEKLSPESFALFMELFSDADTLPIAEDATHRAERRPEVISDTEMRIGDNGVQLDDSYDSYSMVMERVQSEISAAMQTALEHAALPQQQYINIGGALVPTVNRAAVTHLAYTLMVNWRRSVFMSNNSFVNFSFEVENESWAVASAHISAETNAGYLEESYGSIPVVNNMVTFPAILANRFSDIAGLKMEIYFSNGREAYLQLDKISPNELLSGILTLKPATELTNGGCVEIPAVRKHFGIKRLGIADYMKVVQSVHAYVPGEVSNIENVMASELRHKSSVARDYSEITDTTSLTEETEKLSDTTKTSKTDMQTEVAKELEKEQKFSAHTKFSFDKKPYFFEIGAEYANNTSQHDTTKQVVTQSQEITERAMERVLTKITEERVQKIIKEYTETNVHEFDNRGGMGTGQHVTGVYRWVDKKMKNQVYNYGKRTMFEFMIPEPARLHRLAFSLPKGNVLTAPVDPRTAPIPWTMPDAKSATKELLQHWADIYGVTLTDLPKDPLEVNFGKEWVKLDGNEENNHRYLNIPDKYKIKSVRLYYGFERNSRGNSMLIVSNFNGGIQNLPNSTNSIDSYVDFQANASITGTYDFVYRGINIDSVNTTINMICTLSDEFMSAWALENFNAIIKAYDEAYKKFQEAQAAADAAAQEQADEQKEKIGTFYRYMEADTLKHNCIAYLLQDYLHILGQNFTNGTEMKDFEVILGEQLDQYAALAKFMEQAFEWTIMDYTFYPYYWASRENWQNMYVSESADPLFRSFLQAGMARVIVTVRPGFEDAIQFFLCTGNIWNGGEVPVIGDPMYLSIVDEMREPVGLPQGKYWITRIPTTLTILQDKSTGLPVDQPLPIFPERDPGNCENPSELEFKSPFAQRDAQLQHSKDPSTLPQNIISRG